MSIDGILALCGLFFAAWGYQSDNARASGWALALTACVLLAKPLLDLFRRCAEFLRRSMPRRAGASIPVTSASMASEPAVTPSPADARINAAIDLFATLKRAHYQKHVRR